MNKVESSCLKTPIEHLALERTYPASWQGFRFGRFGQWLYKDRLAGKRRESL